MIRCKLPRDATLLDVLIDGFEKNEVLHGFHWRDLPMPDEDTAIAKFSGLAEEARRWKGTPERTLDARGRRLVAWHDLEIRQAGRSIMIRVRAPRFHEWWSDRTTWAGDPSSPIHDWIAEERG